MGGVPILLTFSFSHCALLAHIRHNHLTNSLSHHITAIIIQIPWTFHLTNTLSPSHYCNHHSDTMDIPPYKYSFPITLLQSSLDAMDILSSDWHGHYTHQWQSHWFCESMFLQWTSCRFCRWSSRCPPERCCRSLGSRPPPRPCPSNWWSTCRLSNTCLTIIMQAPC